MRQADIELGKQYLTVVGENLARVVVVGVRETSGGRKGFAVRRFEETSVLPKVRTAAALRPCTQLDEPGRAPKTAPVANATPYHDGAWTTSKAQLNPLNTEVRFPGIPSEQVRTELKAAGYRWSGHTQCWYGATEKLPARYQKAPDQRIAFTGEPGIAKGPAIMEAARAAGTPVETRYLAPAPGSMEADALNVARATPPEPIPLHHGIIDWTARTTSPACGADPTRAAMTVNVADATCLTCKGLDRMIPVGPAQTGSTFTMSDGTRVETTLHELYPAPK